MQSQYEIFPQKPISHITVYGCSEVVGMRSVTTKYTSNPLPQTNTAI